MRLLLPPVLTLAAACAGGPTPAGSRYEVDTVYQAPPDVSLVVMDGASDWRRLTSVIEELHGSVLHVLPPRLVIATLPKGADAIFADLGVLASYDGAIDARAVPGASLDEQRFIRVFDNRYHPEGTPRALRVRSQPARRALPEGADLLAADGPDILVPFASGTVAVAIILPESNGVAEPSTEDWTEDAIVDAYQKVETALEAVSRSEPNSRMRFVIHYASAPGHGGLPGTVDCDYEFGKHAQFDDGTGESMVSADVLARLLGHPVDPLDPAAGWTATQEYAQSVRALYAADAAFIVKVAANGNYTAGLRAHAQLHGPSYTIDSGYGFETFMHETGHIFGALDEYCPDACSSTTSLGGYLGMTNANATYVLGGDGIDNGQGEQAPSLMVGNEPDQVQGYTRGQWGWLDTDGDGLIEVRDTQPLAIVKAMAVGSEVHLTGNVSDAAATPNYLPARSINEVKVLEVQVAAGAPWLEVPLAGVGAFDVSLGDFPAGAHHLVVQARNTVGNREANPHALDVVVESAAADTPPRVRFEVEPRVGSTRTPFVLKAQAIDLDGETPAIRLDTDGDGVTDADLDTATVYLPAGVQRLAAEASDAAGALARAEAEVLVLADDAPPEVDISAVPSPVHGLATFTPALTTARASDADGDSLELRWIAESATRDDEFYLDTGFSPDNLSFSPDLKTPVSLASRALDFAGGEPSLQYALSVLSVVNLGGGLLAAGAGADGLVILDVSDPTQARLVTRMQLETSADQLYLDGTRLYVLGTLLTVVDVSDPRAPREWKQVRPVVKTVVDYFVEDDEILDGTDKGAGQYHSPIYGGRVSDLEIDVEVDHPAPEQLRFSLMVRDATGFSTIVLSDQQPGPGGDQIYRFTSETTPELTTLFGRLATGGWEVRVADVVADGQGGFLRQSEIHFVIRSRAKEVLPGGRLIGVLDGRYPVMAGSGLQVLDALIPGELHAVARLTGTEFYSAALAGHTALVVSSLDKPPHKGDGKPPPPWLVPQTHGFYAVDLSTPGKPRIVREDTSLPGGGELAVIGSRFYLNRYDRLQPQDLERDPGQPIPTQICDVQAFLAGGAWVTGELPVVVAASPNTMFGDDRSIWALSAGRPVHLDVSDPRAPRVLAEYGRPQTSQIVSLGESQAVFYEGSTLGKLVSLDRPQNIHSRTFRLTLEARDSWGAVGRATRTVHVIPYDHPPSVDTVAVVAGGAAGETTLIDVTASDPDGAQVFDPNLYVRADLDDDGVFETPWLYVQRKDPVPVELSTVFPAPGSYRLRVQARDGFYGLGERSVVVTVP